MVTEDLEAVDPTPALAPADARVLVSVLAKAPDVLDELDVTITRTDTMAPEKVGTAGHKVAVVPFNQQASDARVELERHLRVHALHIAGYLGVTILGKGPKRHAQFLEHTVPLMVGLDGTRVIRDDIVKASDRAWKVVDRRPERTYVGTCMPCGEELYATKAADEIKCAGCSRRYRVAGLRKGMLDLTRESAGTAAELSRMLPWMAGQPIKAGTIRQWAARGKLQGREQGGQTVYLAGDVLDLVAERQAAGYGDVKVEDKVA